MRKGCLELIVGLGLLLGPLAVALTLQPEVHVIEIERASEPLVKAEAPVVIPIAAPIVAPMPAPPAQADAPPERLAFAFVTSAGIVLSGEAEAQWGTGRLRDHAGPGQFRASKKADAAKIPRSLWEQRGRTFDLYGPDGRVCTARLGELSILAQHDGPALYDVFEPHDHDGFMADPPSRRQIRARVWDHPNGGQPWLVADVVSDQSCAGALWARDADLPAPSILRPSDEPSDPPSDLGRRRIAELEASQTYAQVRADYEEYRNSLGDRDRESYRPWPELEKRYPAQVRTWRDAAGTARLVELEFGYSDASCGEGVYARITSVDAVTGDAFEPTERAIGATTIFDADLDGAYEQLHVRNASAPWLASDTLAQGLYVAEGFACPC